MRRRKGSGLFTGWWLNTDGKKGKRITRPELAELYRLYRIGTEMGLTVAGAGPTANGGRRSRSSVPLPEQPWMVEANPFHQETA